MHQYATDKLVHILARLAALKENAVHHREQPKKEWPDDERKKLQAYLREALPWLEELGLNITKQFYEQLAREILHLDIRGAIAKADCVRDTLEAELKTQTFFVLNSNHVQYFNNPLLAGEKVRDLWKNANKELIEAGNCFALGRNKACVFHSCIAYEVGLTALAKRLRVRKQNNWGTYIFEIRKQLGNRYANKASKNQQFYAECAERFDALRIARRNPVSHFGLESRYTEQNAKDIFEAAIAFLRQLAEKLRE